MKKVIFIALTCCFAVAAHAQYKKLFFNTLSVASGLPEPFIVSSLQDKLGYMWFGTQNGLVRYDGYQFKPYQVLNDEGLPVSSNIVNYLYEDRSGKLWAFFLQEGLYWFDRSKDAFFKVPLDKQFQAKLKKGDYFRKWIEDKQQQHFHWIFSYNSVEEQNHIFLFDDVHNTAEDFSAVGTWTHFIQWFKGADIAQDAHGKTWIIADTLLSYFDWKTRSFQPYFVLPPDSSKKYYFSVITVDPADADILWLNTYIPKDKSRYTRKFLRFNTKTKAYKIFTADSIDPGVIAAGSPLRIFTDSLKRVWFATEKTISVYNRDSENFTDFKLHRLLLGNETADIGSITSDAAGNLWIARNWKDLVYLNVKNGVSISYNSTGDAGDLPRSNYDKIFFDRTGTLWVNMLSRGIAYLDLRKSLFTLQPIVQPSMSAGKKNSPNQYIICGVENDSIFFVSDTAGLFTWNTRENSFNKIDLKDKNIYGVISSVASDKHGTIWIGTWGLGLVNYDPVTGAIKRYQNSPADSFSLSSNDIFFLTPDKEGALWISTDGKGLCRFNKETGKFTGFPFINNDNTQKANGVLDDRRVLCLYIDKQGISWIGTEKGSLNRFDTKTGKFTSYMDYKSGFFCVVGIYEDSHQRLWAGSYFSGLFLVDKKTGALINYRVKDGLIHNSVLGITEDKKGNLWMRTPAGLSKFNAETKQFTSYPMEIGLLDTYISLFKDRNDVLYVPTDKGLISFDPARINERSIPPAVIIESISYHAVKSTANDKDSFLFVESKKEIELKYNENRINFKYVALHYENASLNQYAYKLDGYDKDWIQAGSQRSVTYTNLSPGTYTFHVKAANGDGVWNETGASFMITILPPWWETWWFRIASVIAMIAVVYAIVQQHSRNLKKQNIMLEEKVMQRTKELKHSLEELRQTQAQLIQSEKMASLGELTAGIAHEIQNPLNFVNNFSEVNKELIEELKGERCKAEGERNSIIEDEILGDIEQNLEKINHHGKRADAIVKGMLQHSRTSTGQKEPTDINALADEYLRLSYHGLRAKDKSFNATLQTDYDNSIRKINVVPQDIGRVLLNLFNNAFYAVAEKQKQNLNGYEPMVAVSTKRSNDKIKITVKDNGNGIPEKILNKIFQPFFTTKPTGQGTGLGLSLTYDILKAHGGEIKVETKEAEGSEFVIQLPINKA